MAPWLHYSHAMPKNTQIAMSTPRLAALTAIALCAFAGNSLLCRAALAHTSIDANTFTWLRLCSGALLLTLLGVVSKKRATAPKSTSAAPTRKTTAWYSAASLWVYAAGFSWAYISMPAATGALVLFGSVQITMTSWGLLRGERFAAIQWAGYLMAIAGLLWLLLPGASAPPLGSALLMALAGVAWSAYSLFGQRATQPVMSSANNFRLSVLPATALLALTLLTNSAHIDPAGAGYALASGALASGAGYAIWYRVLPNLGATQAAALQLSVPIITAAAAVALLGESVSAALVISAVAVLGGIALVIKGRPKFS